MIWSICYTRPACTSSPLCWQTDFCIQETCPEAGKTMSIPRTCKESHEESPAVYTAKAAHTSGAPHGDMPYLSLYINVIKP